jgi:hypothetical protein
MHRLASRLSRGDRNQVFDLSGTKLDLSVTEAATSTSQSALPFGVGESE